MALALVLVLALALVLVLVLERKFCPSPSCPLLRLQSPPMMTSTPESPAPKID